MEVDYHFNNSVLVDFIGSALIRHLMNNTEHTVLNIDNETYQGQRLGLMK